LATTITSEQNESKPDGNATERCLCRPRLWHRLLIALFAVAYAIGMLAWGGATWTRLYGPSPYHRLQAAALLSGHLYIGDSVYELEQNLVLHNDRIQHVWGLGVGMWLAPFELVYRLLGRSEFPDRLALGVAFALLAAYSGATGLQFARRYRRRAAGIGLVLATLFCPALLSLTNGRHLVYEDTGLYACLVSLGILTALIRVACYNRAADYFICAVLASLAGLVRPTHAIYGLGGLLVCSLIFYFRGRPRKYLLPGSGIFAAGVLFLAITNYLRFGSPTEFGHRLNATRGAMVYFTRFDNPFQSASLWDASKEMIGALFFSTGRVQFNSVEEPAPGQMFYTGLTTNAVKWQAPEARWRDMYMSAFDWSYAGLGLAGFMGTLWWLRRRSARPFCHSEWHPGKSLAFGLLAWSAIGLAGLWTFYLRFHLLNARYLLDLAPGFLALTLLVWLGISRWIPKIALGLLLLWLGYEIHSSQNGMPRHYLLTRQEVLQGTTREAGRKLESFNGCYNLETTPSATRIAYNGEGWDENDGLAGAVVVLAVDRPEFVELTVEPRLTDGSFSASRDSYRARIGGTELPLEKTSTNGDLIRVRFKVPEEIRRRRENNLLFLCFIGKCTAEDRSSLRMLRTVCWR
jgi:hypothetical protein